MTDPKSDATREQRERDLATADSVYSEWNFGSYAKLRHLVADALAAARAEGAAEIERAQVVLRKLVHALGFTLFTEIRPLHDDDKSASERAINALTEAEEYLDDDAAPLAAAPAQPEPADDSEARRLLAELVAETGPCVIEPGADGPSEAWATHAAALIRAHGNAIAFLAASAPARSAADERCIWCGRDRSEHDHCPDGSGERFEAAADTLDCGDHVGAARAAKPEGEKT